MCIYVCRQVEGKEYGEHRVIHSPAYNTHLSHKRAACKEHAAPVYTRPTHRYIHKHARTRSHIAQAGEKRYLYVRARAQVRATSSRSATLVRGLLQSVRWCSPCVVCGSSWCFASDTSSLTSRTRAIIHPGVSVRYRGTKTNSVAFWTKSGP